MVPEIHYPLDELSTFPKPSIMINALGTSHWLRTYFLPNLGHAPQGRLSLWCFPPALWGFPSPHFTEEEPEVQKMWVIGAKSTADRWVESELNPVLLTSTRLCCLLAETPNAQSPLYWEWVYHPVISVFSKAVPFPRLCPLSHPHTHSFIEHSIHAATERRKEAESSSEMKMLRRLQLEVALEAITFVHM